MYMTKLLPRSIFHFLWIFLFCYGHSYALQIELAENQTLFVSYNEPVPFQATMGEEVNLIWAIVEYERSEGDEIVRREIFSDSGDVIFSDIFEFSTDNIGTAFEVYDSSVPNYTSYPDPFYADLDQYRDGVGSDSFTFSFTPLSGNFVVTGFRMMWWHFESAYMGGSGRYTDDIDKFSYEVINSVPEPGTFALLLWGGPFFFFLRKKSRK